MVSLTARLPDQQRRLDEDYLDRLRELGPLLARRGAGDLEALAAELLPRPQVIQEVEIEAGFRIGEERGRAFGVGLGLVNLAFSRKFAYSGFVRNRLTVAVRRMPAQPTERRATDATSSED